ncbi:hypothetical protein BDF21DRAFT_415692 [Thamnidium elegans]|nr:hypothetical protein BDF21DRAFT_415692 [Thamnidium elegans]
MRPISQTGRYLNHAERRRMCCNCQSSFFHSQPTAALIKNEHFFDYKKINYLFLIRKGFMDIEMSGVAIVTVFRSRFYLYTLF